jgi:hypothetical protein
MVCNRVQLIHYKVNFIIYSNISRPIIDLFSWKNFNFIRNIPSRFYNFLTYQKVLFYLNWFIKYLKSAPHKHNTSICSQRALFRDIHKVRNRQQQYLEFGHTRGEIQKKNAKKYISIKGGGGLELRKPSILIVPEWIMSFFFPERLHYCYIHFHCSYLYSYYNSARTSCIKCWVSAFHTET